MQKYILVTMPDNSIWKVPAEMIAENRATYYADQEQDKELWGHAYFEEFEYALENEAELLDWAAGNMDWVDVEHVARKIYDGDVDYQEGWVNGEKEIIEE